MFRPALMILAACALAACASTPPPSQWAPRPDKDLAADNAACTKEAEEVNINSLSGYSNATAGAAAAAAGYLNRDDLRGGNEQRVFAAVRDACMAKRGWVKVG